ncbi:MAG: winged helix-turn-helix domain-containing protein [Gallionella sp.]|nr:winged helix-turn-helix domain-containing protein [Gallionella sp.]
MNHIAIVDASLIGDIATKLQQAGYITTQIFDAASLAVWLENHKDAVLMVDRPTERTLPFSGALNKTTSRAANAKKKPHWQLNLAQLELYTPDCRAIPLSYNECCILRAAASANKQVVSRKTLIESLGQNFLHYDERRLEAIISRLRRKLASYAPEGFTMRGVNGQGYLFGVRLQVTGS